MTTGDSLLPCPFCGSTDLHQIYEDIGHKWGYIACFECGAKGGAIKTWYDPEEEWRAAATAQWNRRAKTYDHNSKIAEKIVAHYTTTPAIYGLQPDHKFKEGASPLDMAADIASALSALRATLLTQLREQKTWEALRTAFMGVEGWSVSSALSAPMHVYVAGNLADAALAVITARLTP